MDVRVVFASFHLRISILFWTENVGVVRLGTMVSLLWRKTVLYKLSCLSSGYVAYTTIALFLSDFPRIAPSEINLPHEERRDLIALAASIEERHLDTRYACSG